MPSYPKAQASTTEIAQPLSRVTAASQPPEVLQAVLDSLSKLIPFVANVAAAANLQSESLATHHHGIVRSMRTARNAETENAALRRGIKEMKAELKANDDELKSAEIHPLDQVGFCDLAPGVYRYKVVRKNPASRAKRRMKGTIVVRSM